MRSTQSTTGASVGTAASASVPSGCRTTATMSRYSPGAAGAFSANSRSVNRRRSSTPAKSRNGSFTAFFNFQTVSAPTNTSEICVSIGGAPASRSSIAAVASCCRRNRHQRAPQSPSAARGTSRDARANGASPSAVYAAPDAANDPVMHMSTPPATVRALRAPRVRETTSRYPTHHPPCGYKQCDRAAGTACSARIRNCRAARDSPTNTAGAGSPRRGISPRIPPAAVPASARVIQRTRLGRRPGAQPRYPRPAWRNTHRLPHR